MSPRGRVAVDAPTSALRARVCVEKHVGSAHGLTSLPPLTYTLLGRRVQGWVETKSLPKDPPSWGPNPPTPSPLPQEEEV